MGGKVSENRAALRAAVFSLFSKNLRGGRSNTPPAGRGLIVHDYERFRWFWRIIIQKELFEFCPLTYNGEVAKLTWPLVTDIKNPRYTNCRYLWSYETLKVFKPIGYIVWPLRNLEVRNPFLTLTWPLVTWGSNFYTRCLIQLWTGTEKKLRLCAPPFSRYPRKTGGEGIFCPPPPPPTPSVRVLTLAGTGHFASFHGTRGVW